MDYRWVSHERICQFIREDKKIKRREECSVNISGTGSNTESDLWAGRRQSYPIKYPLICVPISSVKKNVSETGKLILLLALKNKGAILTATERTTGFLLMKKLPKGKNAKALAKELFFLLLPYKQCVHSITSDNIKKIANSL
jgi:IS30 family transposase